MALPIWAIFMKKCYEDPTLEVSKGQFERPANLQIKVDCWKAAVKDTVNTDQENIDEFDF